MKYVSEEIEERILNSDCIRDKGRGGVAAPPCEGKRNVVKFLLSLNIRKELMMDKLEGILNHVLNWELLEMTLSNRKCPGDIKKIKVRPVIIKDKLVFQAAQYTQTQVFHKNIEEDQAAADKRNLSHNRKKTYILPEGTPVPFLVDLGVMTPEGKIVHSKYDKYRQINRFLEFIQDILSELPKDRPLTMIDFGCGKSYLTFAMYYYLNILMGYSVHMIGLDLKSDVIRHCNELRDKYGYDQLEFIHGDIADFEGTDAVDMVVTLHACDTATDYALYKAVKWNAKVILSVPCCQHELNRQIKNNMLEPVLQYGILKERMAALMTDGLRGQLLEIMGYRTQLLEFIDMEHTPKNILIRGVKTGRTENRGKRMDAFKSCMQAVNGDLTLYRLLFPEIEKEEEGSYEE